MATPLTADQMLAALRAEGLHVVEHPGWRTHNRGNRGDGWGPVHGVMIHHTGGTAPSDGEIVWSGRSDLPGPCAHAYLAKDGTITVTGNGRANHAGGGDGNVLQAVIDESYSTRPPAPHKHDGSAGAVDGNARFYGLECSDLGKGAPWPAAQFDAAVRWAAAILRAHGWTEKSAIGHKEWSDWKPDPTFDMTAFRAAVAARLAHPASWNPGSTTPSKPTTPPTEDGMPTAKEIADAVWKYPLASPTAAKGTDPNRAAGTFVRWQDQHQKELLTRFDQMAARLEHLAAQVDRLLAANTKES
ncbi:N-acetylmuramoyl-L-alanine amidase [Streptomyces sp. NPDC057413]|uniref:peptidoglycan recognition protein family protein n=1 Tax=Streptomyces sp. NPDC057413 TaxID=3346124 RepID=UPI0036847FF5